MENEDLPKNTRSLILSQLHRREWVNAMETVNNDMYEKITVSPLEIPRSILLNKCFRKHMNPVDH